MAGVSERQIGPLVYPPPARADLDAITEAENRRDADHHHHEGVVKSPHIFIHL